MLWGNGLDCSHQSLHLEGHRVLVLHDVFSLHIFINLQLILHTCPIWVIVCQRHMYCAHIQYLSNVRYNANVCVTCCYTCLMHAHMYTHVHYCSEFLLSALKTRQFFTTHARLWRIDETANNVLVYTFYTCIWHMFFACSCTYLGQRSCTFGMSYTLHLMGTVCSALTLPNRRSFWRGRSIKHVRSYTKKFLDHTVQYITEFLSRVLVWDSDLMMYVRMHVYTHVCMYIIMYVLYMIGTIQTVLKPSGQF